jgi:hypothetical protein
MSPSGTANLPIPASSPKGFLLLRSSPEESLGDMSTKKSVSPRDVSLS